MNVVEDSQTVDGPGLVETIVLSEKRLAALEARVTELERCKHEDHTIGGEAVTKIASLIKSDIAGLLHPQQRAEAEG